MTELAPTSPPDADHGPASLPDVDLARAAMQRRHDFAARVHQLPNVELLHLSERRHHPWAQGFRIPSSKLSPVERPILSICLIVRNCELSLPGGLQRCLSSLRERAPGAEIVIVDTLSADAGIDVELRLRDGLDVASAKAKLAEAGFKVLSVECLPDWRVFAGLVQIRIDPQATLLKFADSDNPTATFTPEAGAWGGWGGLVAGVVGDGSEPTSSPGAGTIEVAKRYADVLVSYSGPEGDWTREMEWFSDAAAARQVAADLSSGFWMMWVDADDEIPSAEERERLQRLNGRYKPVPKGSQQLLADPGAGKPIELEHLLEAIATARPQIAQIWAPYLYRADADGRALKWHDRERILRWDDPKRFRWTEAAHEFCVPASSQDRGEYLLLPSLLYVHKKRFSNEDEAFATKRHWDVLIKKYDAGDRTTRTCRYLSALCSKMAPQRHIEFLMATYESAALPSEKYHALLEHGSYYAARGFYQEALEQYGAAMLLVPQRPDAFAAAGEAAMAAEDFGRAATWLSKAISLEPSYIDSFLNPRDVTVDLPVRAAEACHKLALAQIRAGLHASALDNLRAAVAMVNEVASHPLASEEALELQHIRDWMRNDAEAQWSAIQIAQLFDYLRRNDETEKAAALLGSIPHLLEDHPLILGLERQAKVIETHLTDSEAYQKFYREVGSSTDAVPTKTFTPAWLTVAGCLPRAKMLIESLGQLPDEDPIELLDIGSYDGVCGVAVLAGCPRVHYWAIDGQREALTRFGEYAAEFVPDGAARLHRRLGWAIAPQPGSGELVLEEDVDGDELKRKDWWPRFGKKFGAVTIFELIEHVPSPEALIELGLEYLKRGGKLFLSTPWGAFDNGAPQEFDKPRDPRGHVRAMTARDMVEAVRRAGGAVDELYCQHFAAEYGNTMHVIAHDRENHLEFSDDLSPVVFAVPGALETWNSRSVEAGGIGASEETIVYLARHIVAEEPARRVQVYGPVPEAEVHKSVEYWPNEQLRRLPENAVVVVSRAPSYCKAVDAAAGRKVRKILWLQDAAYEDLTPEIAAEYEKVVVLTEWHREHFVKKYALPRESMQVIGNFILPEHFVLDEAQRPARKPHRFVYASSPDRGLGRLLEIWPRILDVFPDAELAIFYGWKGCEKLATADPEWIRQYRKIRSLWEVKKFMPGIIECGRVNHAALAREFMQASAWLYPTDFHETGCLTAIKARAAGCVPVCTPLAALAETAKCDLTQYVSEGVGFEERFVAAVKRAVEIPEADRQRMAGEALRNHSIDVEAWKWAELLDPS